MYRIVMQWWGLLFQLEKKAIPSKASICYDNKAQEKTLKQVGVWLNYAYFTHGQLYVAASRVGDPTHLTIAVNKTNKGLTRNVVFKEVLWLYFNNYNYVHVNQNTRFMACSLMVYMKKMHAKLQRAYSVNNPR